MATNRENKSHVHWSHQVLSQLPGTINRRYEASCWINFLLYHYLSVCSESTFCELLSSPQMWCNPGPFFLLVASSFIVINIHMSRGTHLVQNEIDGVFLHRSPMPHLFLIAKCFNLRTMPTSFSRCSYLVLQPNYFIFDKPRYAAIYIYI